MACLTSSKCEAVGEQIGGKAGKGHTLAPEILWTKTGGKTWASSTPSKRIGEFDGLSCPGSTTCLVVGIRGNLTSSFRPEIAARVLTTVNGRVTRRTSLAGNPPVSLRAVSCPTRLVCYVVGSRYVGLPRGIEGAAYSTSNGGANWNSLPLPVHPAGKNSHIDGVRAISCPSTTTCVAVGQWSSGWFGGYVMATRDGGKKWTFDPVPAGLASLNGVWCSPQLQCVAVGNAAIHYPHGEGTGNGVVLTGSAFGTWHRRTVPKGSYELSGVTCVSSDCVGVGITADYSDEVIVSANRGVTWSSETVPPGENNGLAAVSCATKLECVTVG